MTIGLKLNPAPWIWKEYKKDLIGLYDQNGDFIIEPCYDGCSSSIYVTGKYAILISATPCLLDACRNALAHLLNVNDLDNGDNLSGLDRRERDDEYRVISQLRDLLRLIDEQTS